MQWFFFEYEYEGEQEFVKWQVIAYDDYSKRAHVKCHKKRRQSQVEQAFREAFVRCIHQAQPVDESGEVSTSGDAE